MGSIIEHYCNDRNVKRISAQRYLSFNNVIGQTTFQEAQRLLLNNFRNNEVINPYEIYAPESIDEHSRIASIISSLDDKIELNRHMNQTLEQMAC
jgi:hypothetical protein